MTTTTTENSFFLFDDPITTKRIDYSDIDLTFMSHPISGDIIPIKEEEAVKKALRNLILTEPGEKPFSPGYGVPFNSLLFNLVSLNPGDLESIVRSAINRFEKRVKVHSVNYEEYPDHNAVALSITFSVIRLEDKEIKMEVIVRRTK